MIPVIITEHSPRFHTSLFCGALKDKEGVVTTKNKALDRGMKPCRLGMCAILSYYDFLEGGIVADV